jgi:predicted RNA-binding Zn-ribbon protein involved in translation (DUF1610 family)
MPNRDKAKIEAVEIPYSPDAPLDFSCPACGHVFHETLAWLESPHEFPCPECGKNIACKDERVIALLRSVHGTARK